MRKTKKVFRLEGQKKSTKKKIFKRVLVSLCLVVLAFVSVALIVVSGVLGNINTLNPDDIVVEPPEDDPTDIDPNLENPPPQLTAEALAAIRGLVPEDKLRQDKNVINILLLGVDPREGQREDINKARSDSMIILSINKAKNKINMISIMRDMAATIVDPSGKERSVEKINAAHAWGGPMMAVTTVERNLGIKIDHFIRVDFSAFMEIVDVLGGVEIDVSSAELRVLNDYVRSLNREDLRLPASDGILASSGLQHLTGKQALSYARIRYVGNGDFDRTGRQREILDQIFVKMKDSSMLQLLDLVNTVAGYLTTDMTKGELWDMAMLFLQAKSWPLDQGRIPIDGGWWDVNLGTEENPSSALGFDPKKNREYLIKKLYEE